MNKIAGNISGFSKIIPFIGFVFILYVLKPLILPLILACIFAIMVFPIQQYLEKKVKCNRLLGTIISILLIFISTIFLLFILGSQLQIFVNNSETYIDKIDELYTNSVVSIESELQVAKSESLLKDEVNFGKLIKNNLDKLSAFAEGWGSVITSLILIPIYMFFFLYYRRFFKNFAYKLFKNYTKRFINSIIQKIYTIQRSYLVGLVKVILIVSVLNSIGLLILGIDNAIFFGFLGAILIVIPYVGVFIGCLLPAMVALATKDSYWYALGVVSIFGFIQFLEGYFITPKVIGSGVSINSFAAIFTLLAFAMLWGIAGMVVALPVIATIKILCDNSTNYKAFGFILGKPEDKFLKSIARARLKKWEKIRVNA